MSHFESRHDFSENIGASRRISWRPAVGNASFKRQRPNVSRLGRCIGTHVARCSFFFSGLRRRRMIFVRSLIGGTDDKRSLFSNNRSRRCMHLQIALLSCPRDHREGIGLSPWRYRQNRYGVKERWLFRGIRTVEIGAEQYVLLTLALSRNVLNLAVILASGRKSNFVVVKNISNWKDWIILAPLIWRLTMYYR